MRKGASVICAAVIYCIYRFFYRGTCYSENFNVLNVITTLVTTLIILTISSNIVLHAEEACWKSPPIMTIMMPMTAVATMTSIRVNPFRPHGLAVARSDGPSGVRWFSGEGMESDLSR